MGGWVCFSVLGGGGKGDSKPVCVLAPLHNRQFDKPNQQAKAELLTTYAYSWKEGDDFCLCYAIDTGR